MDITAKHRGVRREKTLPQLRFPDFMESWSEKKYGEVFEFKQTNSFPRDLLNYDKGTVKNIHYGDIHIKFQTNFDVSTEEVPFINEDVDISKIKEENYCKNGDLVIADASEDYGDIGKTIEIRNLHNQKVVAGLHTYIARSNHGSFAPGFAGYLMKSWTVRLQVMMLAQGTKVHGISSRHLAEVIFKTPTLPEQQKIASFLSSVDRKIQQLTRKKELLEQYKRGVMQKIFSREIRFKDENGNDYPDWKCKKLGSYLHEYIERVPASTKIPILTSSRKGLFAQSDYFDSRELKNDGEYGVVPKGYFTYRHMSDDSTFKFNINQLCEKGAVSKEYPVFTTKDLDSYFLYLMLNFGNDFKRFAIMQKRGGTRTRLYFKTLKQLALYLPTLSEQENIALFLSAIDKKIETIQTQLTRSQAFKKGLLQQMFV